MKISDEATKVVDSRQGQSPYVTRVLGHSDYICRRRELESGSRVNTIEIPEAEFVYMVEKIAQLREKLKESDSTRREKRKAYSTCKCGKTFERVNMVFSKSHGWICAYCIGG